MNEKSRDFKCWLGMHKRDVLSTEDLLSLKGTVVGKVIITRCSNCGKIGNHRIETVDTQI